MRIRLHLLLGVVAFLGVLTEARNGHADFTYPNALNKTYVGNLFDLGTILGSQGTTDLPTNASTTQNELIGTFNQTSVQLGGSPPNLIPGGTSLLGMYGDLTPIARYDAATGTVTAISGIGAVTFNKGDILFFGNAGRNDLSGGPAGSGGYLLLSDNKTGASLDLTGNGANESPQNLKLGTGGFSVSNSGAVTGTPDNFNNGSGDVVDTGHIILAGKFESFGSIAGLTPPSTFGSLPVAAPSGTVYAEIGTNVTGGTVATGAVGFGYLAVVGGSSASSFKPTTFTPSNTIGVAAYGGVADMTLTINSTFNANFLPGGTTPAPYTQFESGSNDPNQYVGAGVPEPASVVMFAIGLACAGGACVRRRLARKSQLV